MMDVRIILRKIGKSFESTIDTRARRRMPSAIEGRVFELISMRALPNEIKKPTRVPSQTRVLISIF